MHRRDLLQLGTALGAASASLALGCNKTTGPDAEEPHPKMKTDTHPPAQPAAIRYFSRFGVDEALIRETLAVAMAKGGERADVFIQHRVSHTMALEDGEVNRAFASVELGAGVRVVSGDQTGYGYTEDLTLESLKNAAAMAAAIASGPATPAPKAFRADPGKHAAFPSRYALARSWEEVRPEEKLPLLAKLNERSLAADARIKKVSTGISDEHGAVLIADSDGRLVEDVQPMTRLWLSLTAEDKGRRETNAYNVAGREDMAFYSKDRMDRVLKEAVDRTLILFEAVQPPAGEMPIVMAAGSSGILLHEAIGHGMEADFNRKNVSIYADKLNKPIAKPFVSIVDDASIDRARGAINVDDEGNVGEKTTLVEGGTLATYLHDSISAKHYGVNPTGNGRRESYKHVPMPRMRSTYMLPGPHKRDEIIASVKKGIYCSGFSNGQVQIGAGDFTFYVKNGYLIEDGKLTQPIKDVNIIGNGPKVLERIDMVADDLTIDEGGWTCGKDGQSVPVSQGMPTVRVSAITVGGRKG
ncbi:MAG: TldD/PmbA family protein [Polyangiaceae bacterium]|nr:TldD/PmbA family protein [Polyangiaceae bacterium]